MKVIFLDIDGVLNHDNYYGTDEFMLHDRFKPNSQICRDTVQLLNHFIEDTKCKVVITSTWRLGRTITELQKLLDNKGFTGIVVGKTENLSRMHHTIMCRGKEIQKYLNDNPDITQCVIFEDDMDDMIEVLSHTIFVNPTTGLTQESLVKALDVLKEDVNELR